MNTLSPLPIRIVPLNVPLAPLISPLKNALPDESIAKFLARINPLSKFI